MTVFFIGLIVGSILGSLSVVLLSKNNKDTIAMLRERTISLAQKIEDKFDGDDNEDVVREARAAKIEAENS